MENTNNSAKIIDLSELMSQEIGDNTEETKPFVYNPEKEPEDFFGLNSEDEQTETAQEDKEDEEDAEAGKGVQTVTLDTKEGEEGRNEEVEETSESLKYKVTLKNLFGESVTHILQENEQGEEVEVAIEDIEITQDIYEDILRAKIEATAEEAKANTISTDGVSEFTRELIEIDRLGGDVNTLLRSKETYTDVLDKLDLTTKEDQKQAVYLRMKAEGSRSDEEIEILIEGYESKGMLGDKAVTSDKEIRQAIKEQVEQAKRIADEERKNRDELIKKYEKDIVKSLDQFELDDKIKNKIARLTVKRDDNERFEIDNMYFQMKQDPEKAAKLALFILDNDEYNKQVSKDIKRETQLKSAGRLTLIKKKSTAADTKQTGKNSGKSILIDDLLRE